MALSDNIRKYRTNAQMSQAQLAKVTGVDQSAICKLEKGLFIPTVALLDEISRALHVSLDELMHGPSAESSAG